MSACSGEERREKKKRDGQWMERDRKVFSSCKSASIEKQKIGKSRCPLPFSVAKEASLKPSHDQMPLNVSSWHIEKKTELN